MLEQRALPFPITLGAPWMARHVLRVAADLAQNDFVAAEQHARELDHPSLEEDTVAAAPAPARGRIAPTLRARALCRILIDLASNGWGVVLDSGRVFLRAPEWRATGTGLDSALVQREKDKIRASMAARVREQLSRPATRRFISEQESLHFGQRGARSVLSLIADGPSLAASLRSAGPSAIRPYLQVADAGWDEHTGLRLWNIFRYFRYFWSFPYYSSPGRTLPLLVRDAGQPNHPVCGLLCLASPVPKLSVRDTALGLTASWLEAVVAALEAISVSPDDLLPRVFAALPPSETDTNLSAGRLAADLGHMLTTDAERSPEGLRHFFRGISARSRAQRVAAVRRRLVDDLLDEVKTAIEAISVQDLGFTHREVLREPTRWIDVLAQSAVAARVAWQDSRSLSHASLMGRRRDSRDMTGNELLETARDPLYRKKRVAQLASLMGAWESLRDLREADDLAVALRHHVLGPAFDVSATVLGLTGGRAVSHGLTSALKQRLSRFMATQVADISVCGALPPYRVLLGGKLVTLLALSREPAALYHAQYDGQVSDISSKMAGKAIRKPAEILALTTTSFYSVGSSQYNRARLPKEAGAVSWEYVGQSRGHGTLHFSLETSELLQNLLHVETGRALITSRFGEGPSERLRKVRDGLVQLGLPADAFLLHGMPRRVYLAEFAQRQIRPGITAPKRAVPWRLQGPSAEGVAAFWRERWVGPRLERRPEILEELAAFKREDCLLSKRLDVAAPKLALVSGGDE